MSEPFLAEVKIVGFNFAPRGWAFCDGQILPINQNQSLFSLLGTTFGGDGRTSFALPDLRGRTPVHEGTGTSGHSVSLGQRSGEETHTLAVSEMPAHDHVAQGSSANADQNNPQNNLLGGALNLYTTSTSNLTQVASETVGNTGGSQGHNNMQPFLALNFCIALRGLFPSRN